jgi:hypothetical protein
MRKLLKDGATKHAWIIPEAKTAMSLSLAALMIHMEPYKQSDYTC